MAITLADFLPPSITTLPDGTQILTPRQTFKRGQLVKIEYLRYNRAHDGIPLRGSKGTYYARVLEVVAKTDRHPKYIKVRVLAAKRTHTYANRFQTLSGFSEVAFPYTTASLLLPDQVPSNLFDAVNETVRNNAANVMQKLAKHTGVTDPNHSRGTHRLTQQLTSVGSYWRQYQRQIRNNPSQVDRLGMYLADYAAQYKRHVDSMKEQGETFREVLRVARTSLVQLSVARKSYASNNKQWAIERLDAEAKRLFSTTGVAGCGHYTTEANAAVTAVRRHHYNNETICQHCIDTQVNPVSGLLRYREYEGVYYDTGNIRFYTWDDGVERPNAPPPIIGNYHSSRNYFTGPMPNPNGTAATQTPYLGVELEFVTASNAQRNNEQCARAIKVAIANALPWVTDSKPYCLFERDGSVDFEMVTGYGPISTHREALLAAFSGNPYKRDLRSHDGGRCGIHVHLDKPKSLLHAAKLVKFWNDPQNRPVIEAVARRYSSGYAQACPGKADMKALAKDTLGNISSYDQANSTRERITQRAMTRLNEAGQSSDRGGRYVLCNFMNAKTVELRGFRGTLRVSTMIACIEFALMSWYFSRDTEPHLLTTQQFLYYIGKPRWRHETRYLREYLKQKGYDVWMPNPNGQTLPALSASIDVPEDVDTVTNPY
jgi:hypothetical protein